MDAEWSNSHPLLARWLNRCGLARNEAPVEPPMEVEAIRQRLLATLADCAGPATPRVRRSVHAAHSAQELWMLRCELYQVVSVSHGEPEAARRIQSLLPAFEGWATPHTLRAGALR